MHFTMPDLHSDAEIHRPVDDFAGHPSLSQACREWRLGMLRHRVFRHVPPFFIPGGSHFERHQTARPADPVAAARSRPKRPVLHLTARIGPALSLD
jgi:hypothetical protein